MSPPARSGETQHLLEDPARGVRLPARTTVHNAAIATPSFRGVATTRTQASAVRAGCVIQPTDAGRVRECSMQLIANHGKTALG